MRGEATLEKKALKCHHCGDDCEREVIKFDNKAFCCPGCRAVYELFLDTGLQDIYADTNRIKPEENDRYDYLNNGEISDELLNFKSDNHNTISVTLPAIHCSSCVYLLENLQLFTEGIIRVSVNFVKKKADINYNPQEIELSKLAALLDRLGYAPQFGQEVKRKSNDTLSIKIGIAAFCFGNIMLLSFPEYLGFEDEIDGSFKRFFSYLNLLLALPVIFYSASGYFKSAYAGLKANFINIDVPIALGVSALFARSTFEIISQTGPGYLDSLGGLIFFLLIGKWFQNKTYENLSFERDYKSYFPLAATKINNNLKLSVPIRDLKEADKVLVRNQEIIPADAILLSNRANIDYSFVTGEEKAITVTKNNQLFAGGRQVGQAIEILITKPSSQSYLTSLWNNSAFDKKSDSSKGITDRISKYFTVIILLISIIAAVYWNFTDMDKTWEVFTAVLIVACPCALALSAPFTNGHLLRIFGRNKLYLKNALGVEKLNQIDTIVFDKTGTLTEGQDGVVEYVGKKLSNHEIEMVANLTSNSMHPISQKINLHLNAGEHYEVEDFEEIPGLGVRAQIEGKEVKLGKAEFVDNNQNIRAGAVCLSIDGNTKGYFFIKNKYREGLKELICKIDDYELVVLSGDQDQERAELEKLFSGQTKMLFRQQPQDKLNFIKHLQAEGKKVMMLGDGLNDAGALKQSDLGIAITDDVSLFSPACDGILEGKNLNELDKFLALARDGRGIVLSSFIISFLYNIVGISFAVSGLLTPIFAAVLMPLSSISVVGFTSLAGNYFAKTKHLN